MNIYDEWTTRERLSARQMEIIRILAESAGVRNLVDPYTSGQHACFRHAVTGIGTYYLASFHQTNVNVPYITYKEAIKRLEQMVKERVI